MHAAPHRARTSCVGRHRAFDGGDARTAGARRGHRPVLRRALDANSPEGPGVAPEGAQFALALVEAITGIARYLDLSVVAEGIETQARCDLLRSLGCAVGQGYYVARPMPAVEVGLYLRPPELHAARAAALN
ncbi:MAG: EAL domain-containing protein [bacterium]|nr:EAL domain-containing protein [bacterium]